MIFFSETPESNVSGNNCSDTADSPVLSESDKHFESPEKKKFRWSTEHSSLKVKEEFNDFIQKSGPYPTNSKIQDFFIKHPKILFQFKGKAKLNKLRIKLNNSKRLFSEKKIPSKKKN